MNGHSIIALLTDFGYRDPYAGIMKGIISSMAPEVTFIDISHGIKAGSVDEGAYILWSSFKYFPRKTLFVCVVDPGVGSKRKIIYAEAAGYRFLCPDNGLLKYVMNSERDIKFRAVTNEELFLSPVSPTFHGRDMFAPVAANIINRIQPRRLGKPIVPETKASTFMNVKGKKKYPGKVIHIDDFGNIVTDFSLNTLGRFKLRAGKYTISECFSNYISAGERPFAIIGSSGLLEISMKDQSASAITGISVGRKLTLEIY